MIELMQAEGPWVLYSGGLSAVAVLFGCTS